MAHPSRLPAGLSTTIPEHPFANYPRPDGFHTGRKTNIGFVKYENHFDTLIGTDYTVTGVSSTFTLSSAVVGGGAILTPGAATTASSAYKNGQFLQFQAGRQFWFGSRFELSALGGTAYVGVQEGATTTEGLWFAVSVTGVVSLASTVGGVTTVLAANLMTIAAGTFAEVAMYFDGTDLLAYGVANTAAAPVNAGLYLPILARVTAPVIGTTISNVILTPVMDIVPTASQTMTVDYIFAAQEYNR